jgi:hypothetical protein
MPCLFVANVALAPEPFIFPPLGLTVILLVAAVPA